RRYKPRLANNQRSASTISERQVQHLTRLGGELLGVSRVAASEITLQKETLQRLRSTELGRVPHCFHPDPGDPEEGLMGPIRVLLADDHALVRLGFRGLLRDLEGVEVVAEAGDGRTALELIHAHRPDVALVDVAMPELNGLELTARVVAECPHTRVIVLSMH